MRSPILLPMRMNAAETSASSAMAPWTPLTVVSRSSTTLAIDTFINDVSTTRTNIAAASSTEGPVFTSPPRQGAAHRDDVRPPSARHRPDRMTPAAGRSRHVPAPGRPRDANGPHDHRPEEDAERDRQDRRQRRADVLGAELRVLPDQLGDADQPDRPG